MLSNTLHRLTLSKNTYCLSNVLFHSNCVDLGALDISAISSKIKSYCYQDMLQVQKPSEVALLRGVQDGGRGSTMSDSTLKLTGYQPFSKQHQALCSRCPYNILGCKGTTWRGEQIYMTLATHT